MSGLRRGVKRVGRSHPSAAVVGMVALASAAVPLAGCGGSTGSASASDEDRNSLEAVTAGGGAPAG